MSVVIQHRKSRPQFAAFVVEMQSLHRLTAFIEGHRVTLLEGKKALLIFGETAEKVSEQLSEEICSLQREVRDLSRELAGKR